MRRRMFIKIFAAMTSGLVVLFFSQESIIRNKIIGRLRCYLKDLKNEPKIAISSFEFPPGHENVSVEMVLNSRCNSDSTDNQKYLHWGIFDKSKELSDTQINQIIETSKIDTLFDKDIDIIKDKNILTISAGTTSNDSLAMIEAGMQQQAVCLACAALGTGMKFQNLGVSGKTLQDGKFGTTKLVVAPMKESYNGSFWSKDVPTGWKGWKKGNLPDPVRDGQNSSLSVFSGLKYEIQGERKISIEEIGQLLWAAKGRTPHLYKSKPWGMTIPIWTDKLEITSIFVFHKNKLSKYINWENGHPTHSLEWKQNFNVDLFSSTFKNNNSPNDCYFIFYRNDNYNRAFWEIGYELYNTILEANAFDIPFKIKIVSEQMKRKLHNNKIGIPEVVIEI